MTHKEDIKAAGLSMKKSPINKRKSLLHPPKPRPLSVQLIFFALLLFFFLAGVYFFPHAHFIPQSTHHELDILNTSSLNALLKEHNINLEKSEITTIADIVTVHNLPEDLASFSAENRAKLFISFLLPHIHACNTRLSSHRDKLQAFIRDRDSGKYISPERKRWLKTIQQHYYASGSSPEKLLEKVDVIPASLALAQAINESGWGTSRFAREGNALFGQHLSTSGTGDYIISLYGNVKVAAFSSLYEATESYMHNLNTAKAYKELRRVRAMHRQHGAFPSGIQLAAGLSRYSEIGQSYVSDIQSIIRKYELEKFNSYSRRSKNQVLAIRFTREKRES